MDDIDLVDAKEEDALPRATAALDAGDIVVIPGDARYVVAADALDDEAVARLFRATSRPADRSLVVGIGGYEDLQHVAFGGAVAREASERHWPGPAALVLKARPWLPEALTAGGETVAVSVPRDAFARALARRFGPLALAGARRAGGPDALDVASARANLGDGARVFVDAGARPGGVLALVDCTGSEANVIRAGTVPPER